MRRALLSLLCVAVAAGCALGDSRRRDAGAGADAGATDASARDAGADDAGSQDASPGDAGSDAGGTDAGAADAGARMCGAGTHDCGGTCVDDGAVATCGARCAPCTVPINGQPTCDGTDCGIQCDSGFALCRGACVSLVATEASCDGLDDDCDGTVDEGCGSGTCASPWIVPAGGMPMTTFTITGGPQVGGSCDGSPGNGRVHTWTPSASGTATVRYTNDFWPAMLVIRQGGCAGSELACQVETTSWPTLERSFAVTAGTPYTITVAHGSYTGSITLTYHLTVTSP